MWYHYTGFLFVSAHTHTKKYSNDDDESLDRWPNVIEPKRYIQMHQQQPKHTHAHAHTKTTTHKIHMKNDHTDRKQLEKSMAAFLVGFVFIKDIYTNTVTGINLRKSNTYTMQRSQVSIFLWIVFVVLFLLLSETCNWQWLKANYSCIFKIVFIRVAFFIQFLFTIFHCCAESMMRVRHSYCLMCNDV